MNTKTHYLLGVTLIALVASAVTAADDQGTVAISQRNKKSAEDRFAAFMREFPLAGKIKIDVDNSDRKFSGKFAKAGTYETHDVLFSRTSAGTVAVKVVTKSGTTLGDYVAMATVVRCLEKTYSGKFGKEEWAKAKSVYKVISEDGEFGVSWYALVPRADADVSRYPSKSDDGKELFYETSGWGPDSPVYEGKYEIEIAMMPKHAVIRFNKKKVD